VEDSYLFYFIYLFIYFYLFILSFIHSFIHSSLHSFVRSFVRLIINNDKIVNIIFSLFLGADGGLDFGVLKVMDETKQTCSLKNKGRFEINFNFKFEPTDGCPASVQELFTVLPNRGPLLPTDRPTQVQVIFRTKKEVMIREQPILKCQVCRPILRVKYYLNDPMVPCESVMLTST
jgi:hypothetical protein